MREWMEVGRDGPRVLVMQDMRDTSWPGSCPISGWESYSLCSPARTVFAVHSLPVYFRNC